MCHDKRGFFFVAMLWNFIKNKTTMLVVVGTLNALKLTKQPIYDIDSFNTWLNRLLL
jgi:hypothetical protein